MPTSRPPYPAEFRARMVELVRSGSSAPGRDPPAAPALEPLDVAPGREAVGHLQDPEVMDPRETEKATEDRWHQGILFPAALMRSRATPAWGCSERDAAGGASRMRGRSEDRAPAGGSEGRSRRGESGKIA